MKLILSLCLLCFSGLAKASSGDFPTDKNLAKWSHTRGPKIKKLNALYQMYWDFSMITSPEAATYYGYPGQNDRWTDPSVETFELHKKNTRAFLKALTSVSEKGLSGEDLLNYRLLKYRLDDEIASYKFPQEYMIMDQMSAFHTAISDTLDLNPKRNQQDYEDMIKRLSSVPMIIDHTIEVLRVGVQKGVTQPKIVLEKVPPQIDSLLTTKVEDNPIYRTFAKISTEAMSANKAMQVQANAKEIISTKIYPSLQKLKKFLVEKYIPHARENISWSALPDGQNWYNAKIKTNTTLDLTADQIFQIGTDEVKRLHLELDKIREQLNFKNEKKFRESLKDSKFYYTTAEDLLDGYRATAKTIDPELPKFFKSLPRNTYGVSEMPPFKAASAPGAYYDGGTLEAGRAGSFVANTYDLKARAKWAMMDLTCHEAVPGHHFQISIAQELTGLPEFRKNLDYTSYTEGWGLYAETLCDDMGLYKDPYSKYGQIAGETWRAVRLVVDTGIHAKGWTRDQAITYFRENAPISEQDIQAETNRYIVWAGQALAYKLGQLKIKELRDRTKTILGEKFDIRKFHDVVLGSGPLPLEVLDKKVNEWAGAPPD